MIHSGDPSHMLAPRGNSGPPLLILRGRGEGTPWLAEPLRAVGINLMDNINSQHNVEGERSLQSVEADARSTMSDSSRKQRPGPASSKAGARAEAVAYEGALSRAGSTVSLSSLGGESRKRPAECVVSSSDSEGESTKRSRGRPALNPEHVGKYTAEAMAKKAEKAKARQLRKDHRTILDPEIEPSSTSARKAKEKAVELALEFDEQPICAVAAVATRELATIAKSIERSKNIRGDIVRDMWTAYTKLSAALTSVFTRAGDSSLAANVDQREECSRPAWVKERRRLNEELVFLRSRVAVLEHGRGRSTSRRTSGRDRVPGMEWDSIMEWSGPDSLAGDRSPIRTRGRTAPAEGERPRVTVTEEDLRSPYFRPPLQGVSKQLNPLAAVADRTAPVGKTPPSKNKRRENADRVDDEEGRIERLIVRLLPRLLREMGVAPMTAPSTKPRSGLAAATPAKRAAKAAPKTGESAANAPPPAAKANLPPPAVPKTFVDGGTETDANEATWAQVVSRGAKRAAAKAKKAEAEPPRPLPKSAKSTGAPAPNKKGSGGKKGGTAMKGSTARPPASGKKAPLPKLRPPSSAAIVVTCADPTSYQEVIGKARSSISLKDVGIEDLRPRRAITGALIWEVRGPESRVKANALAERLTAVFANRDDVRVSRPSKTAEIRVTGLDDSATPTEVAQDLARACKRLPPEFKVGEVSRAPNGLGTCWVRCPVEAAKQLVAASRVKVGWSSCRVALLPARSLQCFRCLEAGHVQAKCTSTVDRSGCCYRCGGIDHAARECRAKVDCPACRELGRPSGHRIGGAGCAAAKAKGKKGGQKPSGPLTAVAGQPPAAAATTAETTSAVTVADIEMAVVEESPPTAVADVADKSNVGGGEERGNNN